MVGQHLLWEDPIHDELLSWSSYPISLMRMLTFAISEAKRIVILPASTQPMRQLQNAGARSNPTVESSPSRSSSIPPHRRATQSKCSLGSGTKSDKSLPSILAFSLTNTYHKEWLHTPSTMICSTRRSLTMSRTASLTCCQNYGFLQEICLVVFILFFFTFAGRSISGHRHALRKN